MRGAMAVSAAFMLVLAGCDGAGETGARKTIEVTGEAPYVEQLKALGEMNRGLALRRAIQDSGERCKRVDSSGYQQDYRNLSMWTARCSDSGDWALFVAPNGDVQVRRCEDAASLELPTCRFEETTG
ncbi:hypothetical protein [Allosphingosinicella sp.]|uniref:hypothetical protein n=1 Tax=Allosphingosinicella sp. TaxID=2823234 RepID=UPI002FC224D0